MSHLGRVFYVGMMATDSYGESVGEKTYSGAAARKMISVADALRRMGRRAVIVSLPFVGTQARQAFYPPLVGREGRVPTVFLATLRSRYLRKAFAPLTLLAFAWRHVVRGDTVILYNHAAEYFPALVMLRLLGVNVVQDIEDVPTDDERGIRGLLNRISYGVTFRLTGPRKMVVADHVAKQVGLEDYVVIRGVVSGSGNGPSAVSGTKWRALVTGGALSIHFGGTLIPETGVDLFCDAVERLAGMEDRLQRAIVFKVTGVGDLGKVHGLQERLRGHRSVCIELHAALSTAEYLALLDSCHGSLSLKRPGSAMANTTFPSKVIEIAGAGLALVATRLGDVATVFAEESAFFLAAYESAELVRIITEMAQDPERVQRIAETGYAVCHRTFSAESVGKEMNRLLETK